MSQDFSTNKVFIVEGQDDKNLLEAVAKKFHPAPEDLCYYDAKSVDNIRPSIELLANDPIYDSLEALCVVCDADACPNARFQSVTDGLRNIGVEPPQRCFEWTTGRPKACVMILPDGKSKGSLEDVCVESVRGTPEMACVKQFIECLNRKHPMPAKARAYAYLAAMDRPDVRVGTAAKRGYWCLAGR